MGPSAYRWIYLQVDMTKPSTCRCHATIPQLSRYLPAICFSSCVPVICPYFANQSFFSGFQRALSTSFLLFFTHLPNKNDHPAIDKMAKVAVAVAHSPGIIPPKKLALSNFHKIARGGGLFKSNLSGAACPRPAGGQTFSTSKN